jgi:hypothetical protein
MRRYLPLIPAVVLLFGGAACETGDEPRILTLSGQVADYYTGNPLPGVALTWEDPNNRSTTTSGTGAYQIGNLMATEILFITGTLANYRRTRNEPVVLGTSSATANLALVATADAARQYTALGLTETAGTGLVIVNLRNAAGQPHTGIPLADIELQDAMGDPVGAGPFVFGAAGDVVDQATLNVTTEFGGRSRFAILNVPPGTYTLRVQYVDGTTLVKTAQVVAIAGTVTLIRR